MESNLKQKIIVLTPPTVFRLHESHFSKHFNLIKAYESPLPLPEFLATANAAGITAMLTTPLGPPVNKDTVFRHIPSLGCIVSSSAGIDYIDLLECRRRGIAVANASDVHSSDTAEMAIALLIDVLRKISASHRYVCGGGWKTMGEYSLGNRLGGKRVGIIGFGSIGSIIATRLEAFGCSVSYTSRNQKPCVSYPFYSNVADLATNTDVLVVCCALTNQTKHMINKEVLSALGKEGIIINIARGAVVDEQELVKYLVEGKIAGAGLDVFDKEPVVPQVLFTMDNVVLSPHRAAFTHEGLWNAYEHVKANFEAYFSGKPLLSPV